MGEALGVVNTKLAYLTKNNIPIWHINIHKRECWKMA